MIPVSSQLCYTPSSAAGRLVLNVLTSVAQWERETTRERTKTALQHKKAQGQHVGSTGFGYKMVEKKLTQVKAEHETIALIQEMRSNGSTLQEIADQLNADGTATQRRGKWYPTTVSNVLKGKVTTNESARAS